MTEEGGLDLKEEEEEGSTLWAVTCGRRWIFAVSCSLNTGMMSVVIGFHQLQLSGVPVLTVAWVCSIHISTETAQYWVASSIKWILHSLMESNMWFAHDRHSSLHIACRHIVFLHRFWYLTKFVVQLWHFAPSTWLVLNIWNDFNIYFQQYQFARTTCANVSRERTSG